ncbi:hypothetical protein CEXT_333311, partial [Caerostris extrusa]
QKPRVPDVIFYVNFYRRRRWRGVVSSQMTFRDKCMHVCSMDENPKHTYQAI